VDDFRKSSSTSENAIAGSLQIGAVSCADSLVTFSHFDSRDGAPLTSIPDSEGH
jgi:hypothetical protein